MTDRALSILACTLPEGEAGQRRLEVGKLFAQPVRTTTIPDGVELEYASDDVTARALYDFVMFERRCCAQLSYELRFDTPHRAIQLRISGAPELVSSIRAFAGMPNESSSGSRGDE